LLLWLFSRRHPCGRLNRSKRRKRGSGQKGPKIFRRAACAGQDVEGAARPPPQCQEKLACIENGVEPGEQFTLGPASCGGAGALAVCSLRLNGGLGSQEQQIVIQDHDRRGTR
jgi:hypothetical protein